MKAVTIIPDVMGGRPCVGGHRIAVSTLLEFVAAGYTVEQIAEFPTLTRQKILRAIGWAAKRIDRVRQ